LELEITQAAARQDFEDAALARTQLQVALAKLAGVERRIELSQIRAPANGTIMAGEVEQRVGEVVGLGEPLLEFAPHGSWAVELHVHSRDAQLVSVGQTGRFATIARPNQTIACTVQRIEPAARVIDGQTVYVARAHVAGNSAWSLAGMDGVASLNAGRRPIWWIVLHRAIDFVRLNFWV
jgi:multidrug resistance efflux pump